MLGSNAVNTVQARVLEILSSLPTDALYVRGVVARWRAALPETQFRFHMVAALACIAGGTSLLMLGLATLSLWLLPVAAVAVIAPATFAPRVLTPFGEAVEKARYAAEQGYSLTDSEQLLERLLAQSPTPDLTPGLLLALGLIRLQHEPLLAAATLARFIELTPGDARVGEAWLRIAACREALADGMGAVEAYERAEATGHHTEQLHAYRRGDWTAIPALHDHPDYAFPAVVALDLEVDPLSGASPGSTPGERVYEVGAVRLKGRTILARYHSFVRRDFTPSTPSRQFNSRELEDAPAPAEVAAAMQAFIGQSSVVGHNVLGFDLAHLRGLGVALDQERVLDTLQLSRMLFPDSVQHNLATMCCALGVEFNSRYWHTALYDAEACGLLLFKLGEELAGCDTRNNSFLRGIRALVPPGSVLDRVLLLPGGIETDPGLEWELDPRHGQARTTRARSGVPASPSMLKALTGDLDAIVELFDPDAAFVGELPADTRAIVTVASRERVERALSEVQSVPGLYVLPGNTTLLCPSRMRALIDSEANSDHKLLLYCLYQASHNHDAAVLYPFRIPAGDPDLEELRNQLRDACCPHSQKDHVHCPGRMSVEEALNSCRLLLAEHETFARRDLPSGFDLVVVDDADLLSGRLAEYIAKQVDGDILSALGTEGREVVDVFRTLLEEWTALFLPAPGYRERLPLRGVVQYFTEELQRAESTPKHLLAPFLKPDSLGARFYSYVHMLAEQTAQPAESPFFVRACWLDLQLSDPAAGNAGGRSESAAHATGADNVAPMLRVEGWSIRELNVDLQEEFRRRFLEPFARHIICGRAVSLGNSGTQFLQRMLGLPPTMQVLSDRQPTKKITVFSPEALPPLSLLNRRSWAMSAGHHIFNRASRAAEGGQYENSILVSLNSTMVSDSLAFSLATCRRQGKLPRRVAAHALGWSTAKMADALLKGSQAASAKQEEAVNSSEASGGSSTANGNPLVALVTPRARRAALDMLVDVEISGPLRFLNQRDPIVLAQMQAFAARFPEDGPFTSYLLPQALTELKSRLSSPASEHIVLDSRLFSQTYRDEALDVIASCGEVQLLTQLPEFTDESRFFMEAMGRELDRQGLGASAIVTDADLLLVLRNVWGKTAFKDLRTPDGAELRVSQIDIIRAALEGKDQFVIASTGWGKSLCFQMPALLFAEEVPPKLTIVISPLIALMTNQVEELHRLGIFSTILLNSTLSPAKRSEHLRGLNRGDYSILYMAPEQIYSPALRRALQGREIGLIALDEAHCMSQWGHNFRTSYFELKKWIERKLCGGRPRSFPVLALTATARPGFRDPEDATRSDRTSTVDDVLSQLALGLTRDEVVQASTRRPELAFSVVPVAPTPVQCNKCRTQMACVAGRLHCPECGTARHTADFEVSQAVDAAKRHELVRLLAEDKASGYQGGMSGMGLVPPSGDGLRSRWDQPEGQYERGLIYCAYTASTEELAETLEKAIPGLRIAAYHGKMEPWVKDDVLRRFTRDGPDGLHVVVATNAFGMGIDVRRLGFVLHFDTPGTLEAYYQEAGRAGRDAAFHEGHQAECILLYNKSDLRKQRNLRRMSTIAEYEIQDVYEVLANLSGAHNAPPEAADNDYEIDGDRDQMAPGITQKQPAGAEQLLISDSDLSSLAGLSSGDKVGTIIYYLEYHSRILGQPVIERGETANRVWRLKFVPGYDGRIAQLPLTSASWPVLRVFQSEAGEFALSDSRITAVAIGELSANLHMPVRELEDELVNLARRDIISYVAGARVKWVGGPRESLAALATLRTQLDAFIKELYKGHWDDLRANNGVFVNLADHNWGEADVQGIARFLFTLSEGSAGRWRVFRQFVKALRYHKPAHYYLRFQDVMNQGAVRDRLSALLEALEQTVTLLENLKISNEWQSFDIFALADTYTKRRELNVLLLMLEMLDQIKYVGDPAMGLAMRITLFQPQADVAQLSVDLDTLRLNAAYEKHKLRLMQRYAELQGIEPDVRGNEIEDYFQASEPIVQVDTSPLLDGATPTQEEIIRVKNGLHLVEGPAGCGKTTALAARIKYLVNEKHVPLDRLMVTTHLRGAVGRIDAQIQPLAEDGAQALSTTIYSFGNRIFGRRRHLLRRPDGNPYYQHDAKLLTLERGQNDTFSQEAALVSEALERVHAGDFPIEMWPEGLEIPAPRRPYRKNKTIEKMCWDMLQKLRQWGLFPTNQPTADDVRRAVGLYDTLDKDEITQEDLGRRQKLERLEQQEYRASDLYALYVMYLQLMGEKGRYYTFDDQVLFGLAILKGNAGMRREYERLFDHIIVDELQDFTPAAAALFNIIAGTFPSVMAFGDPDQAITVRAVGANAVFDRMRTTDTCGRSHQLLRNFRSTQEILNFALAVRNIDEREKLENLVAHKGYSGNKPKVVIVETPGKAADPGSLSLMLNAAFELIAALPAEETGRVALLVAYKYLQIIVEQLLIEGGISFSVLNANSRYQLVHVDNVLVYYRLIVARGQSKSEGTPVAQVPTLGGGDFGIAVEASVRPDGLQGTAEHANNSNAAVSSRSQLSEDSDRNEREDRDVAQLLRQCVVPYVSDHQLTALQDRAKSDGKQLWDLLSDETALAEAGLQPEQRVSVAEHVWVIERFTSDSPSWQVSAAIANISEGPVASLKQQDDKLEDIVSAMNSVRNLTVTKALGYIEGHVAFLDANRGNEAMILATVDNAKSEEFDTVVVLGANLLGVELKKRMYVSVSRAKHRLFLLCDAYSGPGEILARVPRYLYEFAGVESWDDPTDDEDPFYSEYEDESDLLVQNNKTTSQQITDDIW